ncbi:hypothetical protein DFH08DRAFT_790156 [Mycena albidolilacea]|uniref:Uncharacterized protein n=1 Tax=Mycena albidolilacea TaxID=1033008 RepID=A0AAD6ZCL1_9AGAR|nr:hypothetical protein DFH08DRAFT_790156 [Mycena albidolilacea]
MEDSWTRFKADDVFNGMIELCIWYPTAWGQWLSQANHIFRRLRITSNLEEYVVVRHIIFKLEVPGTTELHPAGFLFLCPPQNFKSGPFSSRWPDCPAYWSLDPSSSDWLTLEEATWLGFPAFQCTTELWGKSWEASVYEGLRKFHLAKGFDPDTQDVARHLGHPLFHLSSEDDLSFSHSESVIPKAAFHD